MTIRYLIAAGLMASACAAHADVIPANGPGIVNGSNVAGAVGDSSVIAGVNRAAGSDALVQALFEKVSASVGSDMKVSLRQGIDGVYVTGLSTAKAAALAGDGMSVISTADGFKIVSAGGGADTAPNGNGDGNGPGNQAGLAADAAEVPEPSSIALMLAGMLGVAGLGRRRAR